jgi:hypothetical protein
MFYDILRIFDFLSPSRTEQHHQTRKPMAIPLDPRINSLNLCRKIFTKLDAAEADVLKNIGDPEQAWQLLSNIRQMRRETMDDLKSLLPESMMLSEEVYPNPASPVRTVMTRTGSELAIFNGGRCH